MTLGQKKFSSWAALTAELSAGDTVIVRGTLQGMQGAQFGMPRIVMEALADAKERLAHNAHDAKVRLRRRRTSSWLWCLR